MRGGFTTGSCAAAATKAALSMLITGENLSVVRITTPVGETFVAEIVDTDKGEDYVSCAVIKDGGDDPDVTTGAHITSLVRITCMDNKETKVSIDGGEGVGRITKPGLDQPVGEAAINSVPRRMIKEAVSEVCEKEGINPKVEVVISVPGGEEIARKTFNPRLGIEGGISIIGTGGVVVPMSNKAIIDTIRVELKQKRALGCDYAVIAPGNYGLNFLKETFGYNESGVVKCSNFIGETVDILSELDFKGFLLCGHIGKLVKVAGGIMNTHSGEADSRMEILASHAILAGGDDALARDILLSLTTEEALSKIEAAGYLEEVSESLLTKILFYLERRAKGKLKVQCILFSNEEGILSKSKGAFEWLTSLGQEAEA